MDAGSSAGRTYLVTLPDDPLAQDACRRLLQAFQDLCLMIGSAPVIHVEEGAEASSRASDGAIVLVSPGPPLPTDSRWVSVQELEDALSALEPHRSKAHQKAKEVWMQIFQYMPGVSFRCTECTHPKLSENGCVCRQKGLPTDHNWRPGTHGSKWGYFKDMNLASTWEMDLLSFLVTFRAGIPDTIKSKQNRDRILVLYNALMNTREA